MQKVRSVKLSGIRRIPIIVHPAMKPQAFRFLLSYLDGFRFLDAATGAKTRIDLHEISAQHI